MTTQQLRPWKHHLNTARRKAGRRLGRPVAVLATVTAALLSAASAAFATPVPVGDGGQSGPIPGVPATVTRVITTGGTPGWQIALIAVGAALIGAVAAVIANRALARRRPVSAMTS